MSRWLLDQLEAERLRALKHAEEAKLYAQFPRHDFHLDDVFIERTATALELAVLDFLWNPEAANDESSRQCLLVAKDAFRLLQVLPRPSDPIDCGRFLLRSSCLAVLGDRGADAARWLRDHPWPELPTSSTDWSERTWATILDVWLRLIRKAGWEDRDAVLTRIDELRSAQSEYEEAYLQRHDLLTAKAAAVELIGLYHLAKAAEVLAIYITDGVVDGKYQIRQLMETHFDRVYAAGEHAQLLDLEPLARLLGGASAQMVDNCIWTVTRAVNSRAIAEAADRER